MAQSPITPPPIRGTVDELDQNGDPVRVTRAWSAFFDSLFKVAFASSQAGTTAQRPDEGLWVGRQFFDTTLGHVIHWDGTEWVDSDGASA